MSNIPYTSITPAPFSEVIGLGGDSDSDEVRPSASTLTTTSPEPFEFTWDDGPVVWSPDYLGLGADALTLVLGMAGYISRDSPEFKLAHLQLSFEEMRRAAIDRLTWMVVAAETFLSLITLFYVKNRQDFILETDYIRSIGMMFEYRDGLMAEDRKLLDAMVAFPEDMVPRVKAALSAYDPDAMLRFQFEAYSTVGNTVATDASDDTLVFTATEDIDGPALLNTPSDPPTVANIEAKGTTGLRSASALGPDLVLRELNGEETRATMAKAVIASKSKPAVSAGGPSAVSLYLAVTASRPAVAADPPVSYKPVISATAATVTHEHNGAPLPAPARVTRPLPKRASAAPPPATAPTSTSSLLTVDQDYNAGYATSSAGPSTSSGQQPQNSSRKKTRGPKAPSNSDQPRGRLPKNKKPTVYDDKMIDFKLDSFRPEPWQT